MPGRGHRARGRERHRVGRRRGLGGSRSRACRSPPRRTSAPGRSARVRGDGAGAALRGRQARPRCAHRTLLPEVAIDNPWAAEAPVLATARAGAHRRLRRHALQRDLRARRRARPAARAGAVAQPGVEPGAVAAGHAHGVLQSRVRRGRARHREGAGQAVRRVHRASGSSRRSRCAPAASAWRPRPTRRWRRATTAAAGPPVTRRRIYLRPAGALHTSAGELGALRADAARLGRARRRLRRRSRIPVEHGVAAHDRWRRGRRAGRLRPGHLQHDHLPYHVLGHNGGIDGFLSAYGYSPSRDVGYVVLMNSTHAPDGADAAVVAGDSLSEARRRAAGEAVDAWSRQRCSAATRATTAT